MKIRSLSSKGLGLVKAIKIQRGDEFYYTLLHGDHFKDGWQMRIPLGCTDFPCEARDPLLLPLDGDYGLLRLHTEDPIGNVNHLLISGQPGPGFLILLDPFVQGAVGDLDVMVWGHARTVMTGYAASTLSRARAAMPVIQVGDCANIGWRWSGMDEEWEASYDGEQWTIKDHYPDKRSYA